MRSAADPMGNTMKFYEVTVQAVVVRTFYIEAEDEIQAAYEANEMFTTGPDAVEKYDQEVVSIKEA